MNVQTIEPLVNETQRLPRPLRGFMPRSFRTKFMLVVGLAVLFTLAVSVLIALWTIDRLARRDRGGRQHQRREEDKPR